MLVSDMGHPPISNDKERHTGQKKSAHVIGRSVGLGLRINGIPKNSFAPRRSAAFVAPIIPNSQAHAPSAISPSSVSF